MICGSRDTWGAPHMSRVPTAVMFLGATWHLLRWLGSEEFRRSWDILDCSVSHQWHKCCVSCAQVLNPRWIFQQRCWVLLAPGGATLTPRLGSALLFDTTGQRCYRNISKNNICSDLHPTSSDFPQHVWTLNRWLVWPFCLVMFGPDPKCHRCTPPISSSPNDIDRRRAQRPHSRWRKPWSPQRPGKRHLCDRNCGMDFTTYIWYILYICIYVYNMYIYIYIWYMSSRYVMNHSELRKPMTCDDNSALAAPLVPGPWSPLGAAWSSAGPCDNRAQRCRGRRAATTCHLCKSVDFNPARSNLETSGARSQKPNLSLKSLFWPNPSDVRKTPTSVQYSAPGKSSESTRGSK